MSPRTILHVSQPTEAGVPNVVLDLVRHQVEEGWRVAVACPTDEGYLADRARTAGATVHPWAAVRSPGPSSLSEARTLGAVVGRVDPDVVHLHSSKAGLAGRLALRGSRPTIFMPHSWSFEAVTGPVQKASAAWERVGARWTDLTLCVSTKEREHGAAAHALGRRTEVVPNGVDLQRWAPGDRAAARERLGLDPDAPLAVCVGRLARQKGQDVLVDAWPQVRAAVPDAELVLVGDGPDRAVLEQRAGDSVRLVGAADPLDWFAAASVIVLPSRWEGMPLVLLEAMASGRSVVCTDVAGMREAVDTQDAVVAAEDAAGLARALVVRLQDPDLAAREGAANRARAVANHDVRKAAAQMTALAESIIRGRHRHTGRAA